VSYARYDDIIGKAYVSVPLIQGKLAFNVAGYWRENDGYFKDSLDFSPNAVLQSGIEHTGGNLTAPFRNRAVRTKLKFTPTESIALTLGYNYTFVDDPRSFGYQMIGTPTYERDRTQVNFQPMNKSEGDEYTLVGEFDFGDAGRLVTHTGYLDKRDTQTYDFDGTPAENFTGHQVNTRYTLTQAIDYSYSPVESLTLLAGGLYYKDRFKVQRGYSYFIGRNLAGEPTLGRVTDTTYSPFDTDSWSVYLDATWRFAPRWYLTVGARYNYDDKELRRDDLYTFDAGFAPPLLFTPDTSRGSPFLTGGNKETWRSTTPHAIVRFEIDPNTNIYASYSRGFKSGTINGAAPFNTLKPETVDAYEVGYKMQRGTFRFESAAYFYDYKNNQVSALSASTPSLTTLIQNAEDGSEIYGVDLSVNWRPFDALSLHAGLAYTHARYNSFTNATNVTTAGGRNQSVFGDWSNRRIARAPDWSGNVGAEYSMRSPVGTFVLSANAAFSSKYAPQNSSYQCDVVVIGGASFCDPAGPNGSSGPGKFEENGWTVVNTQIAWSDPSDRLTLALFAENVTNERYKIISAGSAYGSYEMYNQPRSIGGRIAYSF
jgi:iron complex outermembrane receptor protein